MLIPVMTLHIRNTLLKGLFAVSCVSIIALIVSGIVSVQTGHFFFPPNINRPLPLSNTLLLLRAELIPTFAAIAVLVLYVPVTALKLFFTFEKTKSMEVYFLMIFLVSCLAEGCRFLFPFGNLWFHYSALFSFLTRLLFCARLIAPFCFFLAAFLTATNQPQNADRASIILFTLSLGFAAIIPINTFHVLSTSMIAYGYSTVFAAISICVSLLTFISFNLIAAQRSTATPEYLRVPFGYLPLITGYHFLLFSDNYLLTISGTALLGAGTVIYIRYLHRYYMMQ